MILIAHAKDRPLIGTGIGLRPFGRAFSKAEKKANYDCPFTLKQLFYAHLVAAKQKNGLYKILKYRYAHPKGLVTKRTLQKYITKTLGENI